MVERDLSGLSAAPAPDPAASTSGARPGSGSGSTSDDGSTTPLRLITVRLAVSVVLNRRPHSGH